MFPHFWFVYVATMFVASIIPGPSMMLALTHGMRHGVARAAISGTGNIVASLLQAGVSIAGLGILLTTCGPLFEVIRWAGAFYLIWLGIGLWRSAPNLDALEQQYAPHVSVRKLWLDAFLVAMGNPKAIVFFTALFPQFVHSDHVAPQESCLLLAGLALPAFGAWMIYALCGRRIAGCLSRTGVQRWVNKVLGGSFVGLGVGLAASKG